MANLVETIFTAVDQASPAMQRMGTNLSRLEGNLSQFGVSMGPVGGILNSFAGVAGKAGLAMAGVGAALGAAWVGFNTIKGLADRAEDLKNLAASAGVSTTALQSLQAQFQEAGLDAGLASDAFKFLSRAIMANSPALYQLGVMTTDAQGKLKSTDVIFMEVADAFSQMKDGAEKTALSMEIFGRAGNEIIPILNSGSQAIKTFTSELKAAGAVMDEAMLKKLDEVDAKLDRTKRKWDGFVLHIKLAFTNIALPVIGAGTEGKSVEDQIDQASALAFTGTPEYMGRSEPGRAKRSRADAIRGYFQWILEDQKRLTDFLQEYAKTYGEELSKQAQARLGLVEYGPEPAPPVKLGPPMPTGSEWAEMERLQKQWEADQEKAKSLAAKAAERAKTIAELARLAKVPAAELTKLMDFSETESKVADLRSKLLSFFQAAGLSPDDFKDLPPDAFVDQMGRMGRGNQLRAQAVRLLVERTGMAYDAAIRLVDSSGIMGKARVLATRLKEVSGIGQFQLPGQGANREPSKLALPMFELDDSALARLQGKLRLVPVYVQKATAEMRKSLSEMSSVMQDIVAVAASGIESIMQNLLTSLVSRTTTFKSAMADLWQGVVQIILAAVAKLITSQVISKLFLMLGSLIPGPFGAIFSGIGMVLAGTQGNATVRAAEEQSMTTGSVATASSRSGSPVQAAASQPQQIVTVNVEALDTSTVFGSQVRPMGSMARAARRKLELEGVFS